MKFIELKLKQNSTIARYLAKTANSKNSSGRESDAEFPLKILRR